MLVSAAAEAQSGSCPQERESRKSAVSIGIPGAEATFPGLLVCKGDFWSFPDSLEYTVPEPDLSLT